MLNYKWLKGGNLRGFNFFNLRVIGVLVILRGGKEVDDCGEMFLDKTDLKFIDYMGKDIIFI